MKQNIDESWPYSEEKYLKSRGNAENEEKKIRMKRKLLKTEKLLMAV